MTELSMLDLWRSRERMEQFSWQPAELLTVPISGRWVRLERFRPDHVPDLFALVSPDNNPAVWPLYGEEVDEQGLADHLLGLEGVQFVVVQRDNGDVVGILQGVRVDRRNGTADVGVVFSSEGWRAGWPFEGILLFIDYMITGWRLRKLYFEVDASTMAKIAGTLKGWLTPEVVFRDHVIGSTGGYEDVYVLSLEGAQWETQLVRRLTGNGTQGNKEGPHW